MPDLVYIWCGKIDCTSEYSLKRHLAVCSKRFSAYFNEQVNESDMQIPRFASLKNDDDFDSDNKVLMPMQEDDDLYIETSIQTMKEIVMWVALLTIIVMMTVLM